MYQCHSCQRIFGNLLWKTEQNEPLCIDCALARRDQASFSPDDTDVPRHEEGDSAKS